MADDPELTPGQRDARIAEALRELDTECGSDREDELRLELAELLFERVISAEEDGGRRIEDVRDASYHCQWLIAAHKAWAQDWLWTHYLLGLIHTEGYFIGGDVTDIDSAITALQVLEDHCPKPDNLVLLAELRLRRFHSVAPPDRDVEFVTAGVIAARAAVELAPPAPLRWECETVLGLLAAETIFQDLDEEVLGAPRAEVLDTAISLLTSNLSHIRTDSRLRYPAVRALADLHHSRWSMADRRRPHADRDAELDTAIDYYRQLVQEFGDRLDIELLISALQLRLSERPDLAGHHEILLWQDILVTEHHVRPDGQHWDRQGDASLAEGRRTGDQNQIRAAIAILEPVVAAPADVREPDDVVRSAGLSLIQAYACCDTTTLAQLDLAERLVTDILAAAASTLDEDNLRVWQAVIVAERAVRHRGPAEVTRARILVRDRLACLTDDVPITALLTTLGRLAALQHEPDAPDPRWSPLRMIDEIPRADREVMLPWLEDRLAGIPHTDVDRPAIVAAVAMLAADAVPDDTADAPLRIDALRPAVDALTTASAMLDRSCALRLIVDRRLAGQLVELGQLDRDMSSLRRGVELLDALVAVMPVGHPLRTATLSMFGAALLVASACGLAGHRLDHARDALVEACADDDTDDETRASFLGVLAVVEGMLLMDDTTTNVQDVTPVLTRLQRAVDLLPLGHPDRIDHQHSIAGLLIDRFQRVGDLQDIDAALRMFREVLSELRDSDRDTARDEAKVVADIQRAELLRSMALGETPADGAADPYLETLRAQIRTMEQLPSSPANDMAVSWLKMQFAAILLQLNRPGNAEAQFAESARQVRSALELTPPDSPQHGWIVMMSLLIDGVTATLTQDRHLLERTIKTLEDLTNSPDRTPDSRLFMEGLLGALWLLWASATEDGVARDTGLRYVERSRVPSPSGYRFTPSAHLLRQVADAYWARGGPGDVGRAVEVDLEGLLEDAVKVVLQSGPDRALTPVRDTADRAAELAARCLAAGLRSDAVRAIEAGRGLVLHATGWTAGVTSLLREHGRSELAEEWEAQGRPSTPSGSPVLSSLLSDPLGFGSVASAVPGDLRHRVLRALREIDPERVLAEPPTLTEIATSLTALDLDALVYLLPAPDAAREGRAVLVTRDGRVLDVILPLLRDDSTGPIPGYLEARRAAEADRLTAAERTRCGAVHRQRLAELCGWAWRVAVDPLLRHLRRVARGPEPRIVLVPTGELNAVPWHAARHETSSGPHYAVEDVVFSYASSARQLCVLAGRERRPVSGYPVIVADPTGTLAGTAMDAPYLRMCYPNARFFGLIPGIEVAGPGTPQDVLDALPTRYLPGATVLQLGCHAESGPSPSTSFLRLRGADLTVTRILRRAQDLAAGPGAPVGGLVVLAACQSNVTQAAHDEGLTLCSAFVAAGATGVTATLWSVDDGLSSVLLCCYHDAVARRGLRPMDALRAAQLWALRPDRAALADLPRGLKGIAATDQIGAEAVWAAYSHVGW